MNSIEAMKRMVTALEKYGTFPPDVLPALNALRTAIEQAEKQEPVAWHTVHKAVTATIEKCKAASGMHRAIDLVVNAAQITHDTLGTDTTPPAAIKQDLTPAPALSAPVALNRTGIQKLLEQSGYDNANPEEMAAFISGIRHREAEMLDTPPAATAQKGGEA